MKAEENPVAAELFVREAYANQDASSPREPGVHATDLIFCLRKAWYRLHDEKNQTSTLTDYQRMVLYLTGHGHHQILQNQSYGQKDVAGLLNFQCTVGGSLHTHTVSMNLDFLDDRDDTTIPVEVKSTRKSSDAKLEEIPWYLEQIAFYALRWGTLLMGEERLRVAARLLVLFLNGNYKNIQTPVFRFWDLLFTLDELRLYQTELMQRLHTILDAHPEQGVDYRETMRYTWECGYCPYSSRCHIAQMNKRSQEYKAGVRKLGFFDIQDVTNQPAGMPINLEDEHDPTPGD